jgi:predicted permease
MGFPVMEALFGGESVFRTSVYNIAFQVLAFSVGMALLGWDTGKGAKLKLKAVINPNIVSALLGLAFFFLGWSLPAPVHSAISRIGDITTPLSMVFIGATLSKASSLKLLLDWRLWATSLYRVIAAPLLVYAALRPSLGASGFPIEVPVMIAAMPAAANTAILAEESGADAETASMLVTLSTLISLLTIPLAARFLFGK